MGLGRQLRDPWGITVAILSVGAAWAVGVRPAAAGALGVTVLAVKGLAGLALVRPGDTADIAAERTTDIAPDESVASPVAVAAVPPDPSGITGGPDGYVFRREGEYWRIGSGDAVFFLSDLKGLRYLHCLGSNPEQEVHAVLLAQEGGTAGGTAGQGGSLPEGTRIGGDDSLPVLDQQAKAEYQARLRDLEAEREDAKALNDEGWLYRAELEIDALKREIVKAILHPSTPGRERRAANNVTRAIGEAIDKIAKHDAALAHHLNSNVRRGKFCRYNPGPGQRPNWRL